MDRTSFDRLFDMSDRTVIVTGGTRGIGLALAEGFVLAGARVVVASRKADACEEAAKHLRGLGGQAVGVAAHTGSLEDLDALVDRTVAEFGGVDVVVNNAANALAQPLGEITVEGWTKSNEVNVRGPVFLAQKALPELGFRCQPSPEIGPDREPSARLNMGDPLFSKAIGGVVVGIREPGTILLQEPGHPFLILEQSGEQRLRVGGDRGEVGEGGCRREHLRVLGAQHAHLEPGQPEVLGESPDHVQRIFFYCYFFSVLS